MAILIALTTLIKFLMPSIERDEWQVINSQLKTRIYPLYMELKHAASPCEISNIGTSINLILRDFLLENSDIFEPTEQAKAKIFIEKESKTIKNLKSQKKHLKILAFSSNATDQDKKSFWKACRAISDLKRS